MGGLFLMTDKERMGRAMQVLAQWKTLHV